MTGDLMERFNRLFANSNTNSADAVYLVTAKQDNTGRIGVQAAGVKIMDFPSSTGPLTPVYGDDILIGAGNFDSADGWILGNGWSISGGQAICSAGVGAISRVIPVVAGIHYYVNWTGTGSPSFKFSADGLNYLILYSYTPKEVSFVATVTGNITISLGASFGIVPPAGATEIPPTSGTIDDFKVRPIISTLSIIRDQNFNSVVTPVYASRITHNSSSVITGVEAGTSLVSGFITAYGYSALKMCSTGWNNSAFGSGAGSSITSGQDNTIMGANAMSLSVFPTGSSAFGHMALRKTQGNTNSGFGYYALANNTYGSDNNAFGNFALGKSYSTKNSVAFGSYSLCNLSTAVLATSCVAGTKYNIYYVGNTDFTLIGASENTVGHIFTATGPATGNGYVGAVTDHNTAIGHESLRHKQNGDWMTDFSNCTGLGYQTRTSGDNQVQLGNSDTTTYVYGTVQNRSDLRDKADVRDTVLGLDFINALRPVDYKWDMRDDYLIHNTMEVAGEDGGVEIVEVFTQGERDGSKKRNRYHHGLIAQEVRDVIIESGVEFGGFQDHSYTANGCDVMTIGYDELLAPLIKAVQELTRKIEILESRK